MEKQEDSPKSENEKPPSSPDLALQWRTLMGGRKNIHSKVLDVVEATPPTIERNSQRDDASSQTGTIIPFSNLLDEARAREKDILQKKRARLQSKLSETISKQLRFDGTPARINDLEEDPLSTFQTMENNNKIEMITPNVTRSFDTSAIPLHLNAAATQSQNNNELLQLDESGQEMMKIATFSKTTENILENFKIISNESKQLLDRLEKEKTATKDVEEHGEENKKVDGDEIKKIGVPKRKFELYDDVSQNSPFVAKTKSYFVPPRSDAAVGISKNSSPSRPYSVTSNNSKRLGVHGPIIEQRNLQTDLMKYAQNEEEKEEESKKQRVETNLFATGSGKSMTLSEKALQQAMKSTEVPFNNKNISIPFEPVNQHHVSPPLQRMDKVQSSMFSTGSGKTVSFSASTLELVASKFENNIVGMDAPIGLVTPKVSNEKELNIINNDVSLSESIDFTKSIEDTKSPENLVTLPPTLTISPAQESIEIRTKDTFGSSIFSTGRGKQVKISTEALDRASKTMNDTTEMNDGSASSILTSSSSSKATPIQKQPQYSVVNPVFATPIATPSSSSSSSLTSGKRFVRPRQSLLPPPTTIIPETPKLQKPQQHQKEVIHRTFLPPLKISRQDILRNQTIPQACLLITSNNAICVSFAIDQNVPLVLDKSCSWTLNSLYDILSLNFHHSRLTMDWIANHYRWIVWKLACMERLGSGNQKLTFSNVVQQLTNRSICEFQENKKSAIWKMVTKQIPTKVNVVAVVVLSKIIQSRNPADNCSIVEISDGWYCIEAILDFPLSEKLRNGKLQIGQKFAFSNIQYEPNTNETVTIRDIMELNCNRILSTMTSSMKQPRLLITFNASKPTRWDTKLGIHPKNLTKSISNVKCGGGIVPRMILFVCRKSLLLFREEQSNGNIIFRTQEEEERAANEYSQNCVLYRERIASQISAENQQEFQRKFEEYIQNDPKRPQNRKVSQLLKLSVKDLTSEGNQYLMTVWRPKQDVVDLIVEGFSFSVTCVSVGKNGNEIRLNSGPTSRWRLFDSSSQWTKLNVSPRSFQTINETMKNIYVDSVLVWVTSCAESNVSFAIGFNNIAANEEEDRNSHILLAISSKNLSRFGFTSGNVIAIRDVFLKGFDGRTNVMNATIQDHTNLSIKPTAFNGFNHLLPMIQKCRNWSRSKMERVVCQMHPKISNQPNSFSEQNIDESSNPPKEFADSSVSEVKNEMNPPIFVFDGEKKEIASTPVRRMVPSCIRLAISSSALSYLSVGRKTVEARLHTGISTKIEVGNVVRFVSGQMFQEVEITEVHLYPSFKTLLEQEGFEKVSPWATNLKQALDEFSVRHGGSSDMDSGVVALLFKVKDVFVTDPLVVPTSSSFSSKKMGTTMNI